MAGVAFAFAPFRSTMNAHLHVISSGGIPLALFLLLRGYRQARPGLVLAGWSVAAWQLSLGFTLGLQLGYLLGVLALIVAVGWRRAGRRVPPRAVVVASVAGIALFAAVGAFQSRPYLEVARDHPAARRSEAQVRRYSPPPKAYLSAPFENRIWHSATAGVRNSLSEPKETSLFPGAAIVLLALAGLGAAVYSRRLRIGLGIGVLVCAWLCVGFGVAKRGASATGCCTTSRPAGEACARPAGCSRSPRSASRCWPAPAPSGSCHRCASGASRWRLPSCCR